MKKFILALSVLAAVVTAPASPQDKSAKQDSAKTTATTPPPTPTPDPLIFTDAERREVAPLLQEEQLLSLEKAEAESKLLTIPNSDGSGFEARGRELKDILTRRATWQQKYQAWLQAIRLRASCLDCRPDFQAGRLVKPAQSQLQQLQQ